jgi:hypothetical protein
MLAVSAAACRSQPPPPEVDELEAQLERARSDSRLATDAAAQERGKIVEALNAVAAERSAHAQALSDELVRLSGTDAPTADPSALPTSSTAEAAKPPTVKDVIGAFRQSAESAAELAAKLTGYRAGLVGSIAAACTAAYTVALNPPEKTP